MEKQTHGIGVDHWHRTYTSCETRVSEEKLVSQIASYFNQVVSTTTNGVANVLVTPMTELTSHGELAWFGSEWLLCTLRDRLPVGTDVQLDLPLLRAAFDLRVLVVTRVHEQKALDDDMWYIRPLDEWWATFELKRIGKVAPAPTVPTTTETVPTETGKTIGAQVWATTNLSIVDGMDVAKDGVDFVTLTEKGSAACIVTQTGVLYNKHVGFAALCTKHFPGFGVPNGTELSALVVYYEGLHPDVNKAKNQNASAEDKALAKDARVKMVAQMKADLGFQMGGFFGSGRVITKAKSDGVDAEFWWADGCVAAFQFYQRLESVPGDAGVIHVTTLPNNDTFGLSVRLIKKQE